MTTITITLSDERLTLFEVISLHQQIIDASGGAHGNHDLNGLDSAVAQPQMTFGGRDLYPTIGEKASALGFSPSAGRMGEWEATSLDSFL
jgi:prophage maintenance system killer protein